MRWTLVGRRNRLQIVFIFGWAIFCLILLRLFLLVEQVDIHHGEQLHYMAATRTTNVEEAQAQPIKSDDARNSSIVIDMTKQRQSIESQKTKKKPLAFQPLSVWLKRSAGTRASSRSRSCLWRGRWRAGSTGLARAWWRCRRWWRSWRWWSSSGGAPGGTVK